MEHTRYKIPIWTLDEYKKTPKYVLKIIVAMPVSVPRIFTVQVHVVDSRAEAEEIIVRENTVHGTLYDVGAKKQKEYDEKAIDRLKKKEEENQEKRILQQLKAKYEK